ncbi:MAG: tetratricopeptide repeat protein, partial [Duncaniella sp.]|nr:tetratricopeptide repeat protein [Duncaniella sp.]
IDKMIHPRIPIILLFLALILIIACTPGSDPDPRIGRAESLVDDSPREALAILDSVCPDSLSKDDRHLYDFLTVKASDKAYITHTSDSLILVVIHYAESHNLPPVHLAEALYYGGRVYSDLGDYPTALSYFQQALDALPDDKGNLPLRARILSQTGRLLAKLYLYDEAISYIEGALDINEALGNHLGELNELQLLGNIYYLEERHVFAEKLYKAALKYVNKVPPFYVVDLWSGLADVKYQLGQIDSAYFYLQQVPDSAIHPLSQTHILASKALIYQALGLRDSAYTFARELLKLENNVHHHVAYRVLLSEDILPLSPQDSVKKLITDYGNYISTKYSAKNSDMLINRQNYYNYKKVELKLHEVEEEKAKKDQYILWFSMAFVVALAAFLFTLIRHRSTLKKNTSVINDMKSEVSTRFQELKDGNANAINDMKSEVSSQFRELKDGNANAIRDALKDIQSITSQSITSDSGLPEISTPEMRENLLQKVTADNLTPKKLSHKILSSDCYATLLEHLKSGTSIESNIALWKEIENLVLSDDPEFKNKLITLARSRIGNNEWELALLIRLGFGTNEMASLLSKTKSAIDSRRYKIGQQMFDQKLPSPVITSAIEQL